MDAKLIKEAGGYDLYRIDENGKRVTFASTQDYKQKLSLKNCQAIANGYDLDELALEFCYTGNGVRDKFQPVFRGVFKDGFRKALSILGDKKFSEEDMISAFKFGWERRTNEKSYYQSYEDFFVPLGIPSKELQQTEWDVEIEMDILNEYDQPKLDADGCLILKRK